MKYIIIITLISIFVGCSEAKEKGQKEEVVENVQEIAISSFESAPHEIDGCSCYFSLSKNDFEAGKFIYFDDFGEKAFVIINGQQEELSIKSFEADVEKMKIETWFNDSYTINIEMKQDGQIDETWQYKGSLEIISKDNQSEIVDLVGECGC